MDINSNHGHSNQQIREEKEKPCTCRKLDEVLLYPT